MNDGSVQAGVSKEHGDSSLIAGDLYPPTRRWTPVAGKGVSPFKEALSGRQRLLSYDSLQPQPDGHFLLVFGIEHHPLILDHHSDDGLCRILDGAHPTAVTFFADTLYDEIRPLREPVLAHVRLGALRPPSMASHNPNAWARGRRLGLGQDLRCPDRDDVLPTDLGLGTEDASLSAWWYDSIHDRYGSAETGNPEGRRNPRSRARRLRRT